MGQGPEEDGTLRPYRIAFKRSAEKEFLALPRAVQDCFAELLGELARDPMRPRAGFGVKPLHGGAWSMRVGHYRGIYEVEGRTVRFTRFGHRSTVYR